MTDTGWVTAGTVTDGSPTGGTQAWSNPNNALTDDSSYAEVSNGSNILTTHYLRWSNFGFSIPSTATILGIEVGLDRWVLKSSGPGLALASETVLKLVNESGSLEGTSKHGGTYPTVSTLRVAGGSASLWGGTWTPSNINDIDFGVASQSTVTGDIEFGRTATAKIDFVKIKVYYSSKHVTPTIGSTSSVSETSLTINWTDNSTGEGGFEVQASANGGAFSTIVTTSANVSFYNWASAIEGTKYEFRVRATAGTLNTSDWSSTSSAVRTTPSAPSSVVAAEQSNNDIIITWHDNSSKETEQRLQREINNSGTWVIIGDPIAANATTYTDTKAAIDAVANSGDTISYRVRSEVTTSPVANSTTREGTPIVWSGPTTFIPQIIYII